MRDFEKYLMKLDQDEKEKEEHSLSNGISPTKKWFLHNILSIINVQSFGLGVSQFGDNSVTSLTYYEYLDSFTFFYASSLLIFPSAFQASYLALSTTFSFDGAEPLHGPLLIC